MAARRARRAAVLGHMFSPYVSFKGGKGRYGRGGCFLAGARARGPWVSPWVSGCVSG